MAFGDLVGTPTKFNLVSGEATVTFSAPTSGNLLIFAIGRSATHSAGGAWGTPSGWTALHDSGINVGNMAAAAFFKISDGTETSVATAGTNVQGNTQGFMATFEGPFAASPLDVQAENAASLSTVVASISTGTTGTTAQNDELAIAIWAYDRADTVNDVRAYTNSFTEAAFNDGTLTRAGAVLARLVLSATGTVECTFSVTDTGDEMYGQIATFKKEVAGGDTTLVVADATHSHTADASALTQAYVLTVQDAGHASGAENVALEQAYLLAVADATHSHTADTVAPTQAYLLAVGDATHVHTSDNVTVSPDSEGDVTLVVADAEHLHTADGLALVQGYVLVVSDATHSHTAAGLDLVAQHVLAVADATHVHGAETVVLDFHPLVSYLYPGTRDVRRAKGRGELLSDAPGRARAKARQPIDAEG